MKPYYEHGGITLYCADSRELLPQLPKVGLIVTDPPYSQRSELEYAATGNIAVILHLASEKCETLAVFGTSSGRGIEFTRAAIRSLPYCRVLTWHRRYVNSPAGGPWRWDTILIHIFGKGVWGRPETSSLIQTDGTKSLALLTGHPSPVWPEVFEHIITPTSSDTIIDPFAGSGQSLIAARRCGRKAIGIEVSEEYCEGIAKRLTQENLPFEAESTV